MIVRIKRRDFLAARLVFKVLPKNRDFDLLKMQLEITFRNSDVNRKRDRKNKEVWPKKIKFYLASTFVFLLRDEKIKF
jgi:hypothetical protein